MLDELVDEFEELIDDNEVVEDVIPLVIEDDESLLPSLDNIDSSLLLKLLPKEELLFKELDDSIIVLLFELVIKPLLLFEPDKELLKVQPLNKRANNQNLNFMCIHPINNILISR